jgi:hypothetical protein
MEGCEEAKFICVCFVISKVLHCKPKHRNPTSVTATIKEGALLNHDEHHPPHDLSSS